MLFWLGCELEGIDDVTKVGVIVGIALGITVGAWEGGSELFGLFDEESFWTEGTALVGGDGLGDGEGVRRVVKTILGVILGTIDGEELILTGDMEDRKLGSVELTALGVVLVALFGSIVGVEVGDTIGV